MDRKEAIEILKNTPIDIRNPKKNIYDKYFTALILAIEALQETKRKKGKWIILSSNEDSAVCKCSVCGEDFIFYNGEFFPNYCGDCGTDMKGEQK